MILVIIGAALVLVLVVTLLFVFGGSSETKAPEGTDTVLQAANMGGTGTPVATGTASTLTPNGSKVTKDQTIQPMNYPLHPYYIPDDDRGWLNPQYKWYGWGNSSPKPWMTTAPPYWGKSTVRPYTGKAGELTGDYKHISTAQAYHLPEDKNPVFTPPPYWANPTPSQVKWVSYNTTKAATTTAAPTTMPATAIATATTSVPPIEDLSPVI